MMSVPSISALTAGISLSACTQARTKKPMKPSLMPCFFSNRSRYWVRSAITCVMSTSLKVVSMAAVFCASLSRRAMVWRSRVMCTRSSRAASSAGDGARICIGACAATGVGCAAERSIAAIMSPLVTWPCMPEPATCDGSTPLSAAILRTDGGAGIADGAACGISRGCGCSGPAPIGLVFADFSSGVPVELAAGFVAVAGLADAAAPPSLIWPRIAPTATVSPSFTAMSPSTPAAGAGTSSVTLSVSSSTSGSSTATASPGFLNHLPTVASVTDSPSVGTRMSAMTCSCSARAKSLSQCFFQQLLQLRDVFRHLADRGRCRGRTAGITHRAVLGADLVEHPLQEHVDEEPGAHIARLFLAPHHLGLLEARELRDKRLRRERIELFDAQQINVVDTALLALLVKVVIDLARAHDDAPDLLVRSEPDFLILQQLRVIPQQA